MGSNNASKSSRQQTEEVTSVLVPVHVSDDCNQSGKDHEELIHWIDGLQGLHEPHRVPLRLRCPPTVVGKVVSLITFEANRKQPRSLIGNLQVVSRRAECPVFRETCKLIQLFQYGSKLLPILASPRARSGGHPSLKIGLY